MLKTCHDTHWYIPGRRFHVTVFKGFDVRQMGVNV